MCPSPLMAGCICVLVKQHHVSAGTVLPVQTISCNLNAPWPKMLRVPPPSSWSMISCSSCALAQILQLILQLRQTWVDLRSKIGLWTSSCWNWWIGASRHWVRSIKLELLHCATEQWQNLTLSAQARLPWPGKAGTGRASPERARTVS